jgi:hypothetical protein
MKAQNFDSLNNFDRSIEEGLNWANKKREFANKNMELVDKVEDEEHEDGADESDDEEEEVTEDENDDEDDEVSEVDAEDEEVEEDYDEVENAMEENAMEHDDECDGEEDNKL